MVVGEILLAVSLLLLTLTSVGALAADVKTQTSIQYLWYNDPFQDKTQGYLLQYVKLSATKIDAAGRFPPSATAGSTSFTWTRWTNWTTAP